MLKSLLKQAALISTAALSLVANNAQASGISFGANSDSMINDCDNNLIVTCAVLSGLDIPNPVAKNPNDGRLLVWEEVQALTLANDLTIDVGVDMGTTIEAGTTISSFMVQWDGLSTQRRTVNASIEFGTKILGAITSRGQLLATDDLLGATGVTYNDFRARGLEGRDSITLLDDGYTLDLSLTTTSPGDWFRVITVDVPEPGSLALLGLGLVGLGLSRKRGARLQK